MSGTRCSDPVARFFARTVPEPNTGCLLWTAAANKKGYGIHKFWPTGDTLAHRAAWFIAHGKVPHGLFVLHRCDTPACVNVEHLFVGTNADNVADRHAKGRDVCTPRHGEENGEAKLTRDDVAEIFRLAAAGGRQNRIAERFGVTQSAVSSVLVGKNWSSSQSPGFAKRLCGRRALCIRGHDLTNDANVFVRRNGRRRCRLCMREAERGRPPRKRNRTRAV